MWLLLLYLVPAVQAQNQIALQGSDDPCQGRLEVYNAGKWGLVCYHGWNSENGQDEKNGEVVCRSLGCGKHAKSGHNKDRYKHPSQTKPKFWMDEVKCSGKEKNLWDCKKPRDTHCEANNYVVVECSAQNRIALRGPDGPCEGRLEVYNAGEWGLVCYHGWNSENGQDRKNGEVVCRSLGCGKHVESGHNKDSYSHPPLPTKFWMDEVKCSGSENNLWDCKKPGDTHCEADNYVTVKCSGPIELSLNRNGKMDECAGVVQFNTTNGYVSVCDDEWNKAKADMVCKELKCGKHHKIPQSGTFQREGDQISLTVPLRCAGNEDFSWQCVNWVQAKSSKCSEEANVICSNYKVMRLRGDDGDVCNGTLQQKDSTENSNWVPVPNPKGGYRTAEADDICSKLNCGKSSNVTRWNESEIWLTCTDRVKVELEHGCSGKIYVRLNETRHDVCSDGMTNEAQKTMGKLACQQLNCGKMVGVSWGSDVKNVLLRQVDCSGQEDSLWECLARYGPGQPCQSTATVSCAGSVKAKLNDPRDKCAGRLELFYLGKWQPVCADGVSQKTQTTICRSLGCGEVISFTKYGAFKPEGLSGITCATNISTCDFSKTKIKECFTGHLNCSGWRRLLLTDPENACAGKVYAQDHNGLTAVSKEGWVPIQDEALCKHLKCGKFSNYSEENQLNEERNRIYNCSGTPKSILDCRVENKTEQFQHLNIKCDGNPEVNLLRNCKGEVRINQKERMCGVSQNTDRVLSELCHHLNCRHLITSWSTEAKGEAQYFSCLGHENRLWQCNSWKDSCDSVISVACANGVEFNFTEKCGGELQVRYRGNWEPVCLNSLEDAHVICRKENCGNATRYQNSYSRERVQTSFKCEKGETDPKSCIKYDKYESCQQRKAIIYCEKHVPVENTGLIVGLMVGLLFLLVVTVVIWQRKRFLAILRLKPSAGDKDVELSSKEMQDLNKNNRDLYDRKSSESETHDYEDVDPVMNPMEDESESQGEDEEKSSSGDSSRTQYDDVEESSDRQQEPENSSPAQPLLPPRPANLLDDVNYEAELEVLEDYDDAMPAQAVVSESGENPGSEASEAADMLVGPDG